MAIEHRLTIAIRSWVSMWASMIGVFSSLSLNNYLCDDIGMVLKTGPGREPERRAVPVSLVRPGSDRWSNR